MIRLSILFAFLLALSCNTPKSADVPVEGTSWVLVSYRSNETRGDMEPAIAEREANLLMDDGKISGSTGCNRYNGGYTMKEGTLLAANVAMTKMFCRDAAEQEKAFTTVLNGNPSVSVDKGQMTLATDKGAKLVFRPAADTDQTDTQPTSAASSEEENEKKN